jgi:hypothetical protein
MGALETGGKIKCEMELFYNWILVKVDNKNNDKFDINR